MSSECVTHGDDLRIVIDNMPTLSMSCYHYHNHAIVVVIVIMLLLSYHHSNGDKHADEQSDQAVPPIQGEDGRREEGRRGGVVLPSVSPLRFRFSLARQLYQT